MAIDFVFICDIFVNFRSATWKETGELEMGVGRITVSYLKSWFLIDAASSIPIDLIIFFTEASSVDGEGAGDNQQRILV